MSIDECLTDPKKNHWKKPWSKAWHRPHLQLQPARAPCSTPGSRERQGAPAASRRAFSRPASHRSGNDLEILPTVPTDSALLFSRFQFLRHKLMRVMGTSGATSQRPMGARTRGFVCVKARKRSFTHSKSHALLLSVRFFPEQFGELKTT